MPTERMSINLDAVIAIRWHCPTCGTSMEFPIRRKLSRKGGQLYPIRSCPVCNTVPQWDDADLSNADAWQLIDELIGSIQKRGSLMSVVTYGNGMPMPPLQRASVPLGPVVGWQPGAGSRTGASAAASNGAAGAPRLFAPMSPR